MLFAPLPTRTAKAGVREYTWYSERMPKRIDLAWHPYRPELTVDSTVDISLSASRARVRQRLRFQFPQTLPTQVTLRGSPHVELAAVAGGRFVGEPDDNGDRDFVLQSPVGPEHTVQLEYALALADQVVAGQTRSQSVPLFQAVAATRGRTRVRIWSDADLEVLPEGKEWQERPTEVVPDRDSLPALVLDGGLAGAVPVRSAHERWRGRRPTRGSGAGPRDHGRRRPPGLSCPILDPTDCGSSARPGVSRTA